MLYNLTEITPAAAEPVAFAELRAHLRVDDAGEKSLIEGLGRAGRRLIENVCRLTMVTTAYEMTFDEFADEIRLPKRPVLDADSITVEYVDANGATQTMVAGADYHVSLKQPYTSIHFETQPALIADRPNAITVTFEAGYGEPDVDEYGVSAVPEELKLIIKEWVATNFENRESVIVGKTVAKLPYGFEVIVKSFSAPEAY